MKQFILSILSKIRSDYYERLMAHSLLRYEFKEITQVPAFKRRELLWDDAITHHLDSDSPITFVEFGVFEGHSIRYFASNITHPDSRFIGLDSFEGLPEDWGTMKKGAFSVGGSIPKIDDSRVGFIKGWFQLTWDDLESELRSRPLGQLVVHYDADLYSSTLFALSQMDRFNVPYVAIFDEIVGHETRALRNYCQAYGATVQFLGRTLQSNSDNYQVTCKITPMRATQ